MDWRRRGAVLETIRKIALEARLRELEAGVAKAASGESDLRTLAAVKVRQGANLTRREAAALLGVSTKTLQRMETDLQLRRCPGLAGVVRYAARDVLRLASAA